MIDADPTSLDRLHDIVMPPPVPWWPPAPGWWVVGSVVLALTLWAGWRAWSSWRAAAYRRAALAELRAIEARAADDTQRAGALAELPALVKRTALAAFPRAMVASLSGEAWLRFLDRTGRTEAFTAGGGRPLGTLAYDPGAARLDAASAGALLAAVRSWIGTHDATLAAV